MNVLQHLLLDLKHGFLWRKARLGLQYGGQKGGYIALEPSGMIATSSYDVKTRMGHLGDKK